MELSGRVDVDIAPGTGLFLYGGPVAEPALGPSAFMHRASAQYLPLAPITHHWFEQHAYHLWRGDGRRRATALPASRGSARFTAASLDQFRWNIEDAEARLSWSVRATWTPSPAWAIQVDHGRLESPEQLGLPPVTRRAPRQACSLQGRPLHDLRLLREEETYAGRTSTAWLAGEANWNIDRHHTLFGRAENIASRRMLCRRSCRSLRDRDVPGRKQVRGRLCLSPEAARAVPGWRLAGRWLPLLRSRPYSMRPIAARSVIRCSPSSRSGNRRQIS